MFKGRTVVAFILLTAFASSIITLTLVHPPLTSKGSKALETAVHTGFTKEDIDKITSVYTLMEKHYFTTVDKDRVLTGAIQGMVKALEDPFSVYMDEEQAALFSDTLSSTIQGIGAEMTKRDGKIVVVSPLKNSPAQKAGIQTNDVIVSVNGKSLDGLTLSEAITKTRGPKGSHANLQIAREGIPEPLEMIVVRDDIDQITVSTEMLDGQIGKIEIRHFSPQTASHFAEDLIGLEDQGLKGLVIDLRNNPGGYVEAAVLIANQLVPKGHNIVMYEFKNGIRETVISNGGPGKRYPISVLINQGSASASEVLAGALQQSASAKLIGETSFGKGTVQTEYKDELGDGSSLKLTISKWLTPDGTWVHEKGITPDIAVEQPEYFKTSPLNKDLVSEPGTISENVKNIQIMLRGLGYSVDRTDGYFSQITEEALQAFQFDNGLQPSGTVDKETLTLLEEAVIEAINQPKNDLQLTEAHEYMRRL